MFLMLSQGAGHFLKAYISHVAHSSTGGSEVPAYDRCYILTTDVYCNAFRTSRHYGRRSYPNVRIFMVFQYLDDVCESVNLTTAYSATLSVGEKNLEPIFLGQCVRQTLNNGITLICACSLK